MSHAAKQKIIVIVIIIAMLALAGILISVFAGPRWESFNENEKCKGFFDTPIVEMELQKLRSEKKVRFNDKDLIDQWEDFFKALEIKRLPGESVFYEDTHDEVFCVIVKTESADYDFSSPLYFRRDGKMSIKIGEDYYDFKSNKDFENLFNQVYNIAAKRYGEVDLGE